MCSSSLGAGSSVSEAESSIDRLLYIGDDCIMMCVCSEVTVWDQPSTPRSSQFSLPSQKCPSLPVSPWYACSPTPPQLP